MWIMRDQKIIKNILDSQTSYKSADLLSALEAKWGGKNPDRADPSEINRGIDALRQIVGSIYGLSDILFPRY